MKRPILTLLISCITILSIFSQQLKVGAAVRIITPHPLLPVSGGVGSPHPVHTKKGDLFARAVVFQKGQERFAIVGIDNLGWPGVLGDKSRALINGIHPNNILIGATHTHSAPDAYGFVDQEGNYGADLDYLDWCVYQIADAVNEAIDQLEIADLKIAVGKAKGKIAYNYYAPDLYDPRCGVIQAISKKNNKIIATLINYAIHPEVIGDSQGIISPDMIGPLYERIENKTGGIAIFMNGAQGGMVTADNRLDQDGEALNWEECQRIGMLLADEALRIIGKTTIQKNPDIYCASKEVAFPVESEMMQAILKSTPLGINISDSKTISTTINLLNIGSAQVLTIPGEALPNIGYYLKRKMPTAHSFLFGLTNDAYGYILTKVDYDSFDRYNYITRTSLGEMTGEILIEELLDMINNNPEPVSK